MKTKTHDALLEHSVDDQDIVEVFLAGLYGEAAVGDAVCVDDSDIISSRRDWTRPWRWMLTFVEAWSAHRDIRVTS